MHVEESTRDALLREVQALRQRVAQMEQAEAGRRQTEEALQRQPGILQSILDSIDVGVAVVDERGRFLFWNTAGKAIAGVGPQDVLPEHWAARYGIFCSDQVTPYP